MQMIKYVINRLLSAIILLFIVSVIVFSIIHLTPGDPAATMLGGDASRDDIDRLREQLGLNLPLIQQFAIWLLKLLHGDLGTSIFYGMPVTEVIVSRLGPTCSLAALSLLVSIIIAIPLGVLAALKQGRLADKSFTSIALIGISTPTFLMGMLLMIVFGVILGWLPVAGYQPLSAGFGEHIRYLILPSFTLGLMQSALLMRITRSSMLDVIKSNFIQACRARGLGKKSVIIKHALRNAFLPILTVLGLSLATLFGGTVITETVFNIPGLGQMIVNSVLKRDYVTIQGAILFLGIVYVTINLIIDLLYPVIDPRIKLTNNQRAGVK